MLKNIPNISITIIISLCLLLSSCADTSVNLASSPTDVSVALAEKSAENYSEEAIATLYDVVLPEVDGSSASMRAYAEELSDYWLCKITELTVGDEALAAKFEAYTSDLSRELSKEAEKYRSDGTAPYGSAVTYELIMKRAEALEVWYYTHCYE